MNTGQLVPWVDYGFFAIGARFGDVTGDWRWENPAVVAAPSGAGAAVHTGISMGPVNVSWRVAEEGPPDLDSGEWEDIGQVVVVPEDGELRIGQNFGEGDLSPNLALEPDDEYVIRVYARGRDLNAHGVDEEPHEEYLIDIWPRRPEGDEPCTIKATSEFRHWLMGEE